MKYNLTIAFISSTLLNGCLGGNSPVGTYYTPSSSSYSSIYTPSYTSNHTPSYTPSHTLSTHTTSRHNNTNRHHNSDYSNGRRDGDYSGLIWNGSGEAYTREGSRMRQYDK